MTKDDTENTPSSGVKRALAVSATIVLVTFMLGMVVGISRSVLEGGEITFPIALVSIVVATLLALSIYLAWKVWPRADPKTEAQSTIKSRNILLLLVGVGIVLGIVFGLAEGEETMALVSNGPLAPLWAGVILLVWLVLVPVLSWMWWKSVDEHEATAYRDGGFWAMHLYMFLVPAWWIAERAGWLPSQDPMIVFLIVCFFWCVIWFHKKYF